MTRRHHWSARRALALLVAAAPPAAAQSAPQRAAPPAVRAADYDFDDSHFHLTNYVQEGTSVRDYLRIMGTRVGRSTLFGIPLQQTWAYANSGSYAPTYYLQSDAPLYYYSFTDAFIAMAYRSLSPEQRARFDPMITGFNPADMYACCGPSPACSRGSASSASTRNSSRPRSRARWRA
jgi:hypothetical protein